MRDSYMLYTDKLEGEYKDVFKQIENYVMAERIDEDTQEEYMGELLDVFLIAQEEGRPAAKITGDDIGHFCKSFCADFTWKNKILAAIDTWKNFACIIFLMSSLEVLAVIYAMTIPGGREINFWTEPYEFNLFGYFLGFMAASISASLLGRLVRKAMFKMKKASIRVWQMINWFGTAVIFFVILLIFFSKKTDIIQFPAWVLMLCSGIVLVVYYVLNRARIKARKEHEVKFWDEVKNDVSFDANTENLFSEQMEKKWEKKNRKLLKKGKPAMTRAEILDAEEAECLKTQK